jgi:transcriptional regulator with XRE-family HTH domain
MRIVVVAKPITSLRQRRSWSRYRLAKEADISRSQVANIESGRDTKLNTLVKIFLALDVEQAIFGRDGDSYHVVLHEGKGARRKP